MNIEYDIWIKDTLEGYEYIYDTFEDINTAIEQHRKLVTNKEYLKGVLMDDLLAIPIKIDQYHLEHPFKRFDVTLEVDYD